MFKWVERSNIPNYSHEMLHYRNAMVKEINFAFSSQGKELETNKILQEQFERFKDHREKTGNRIQKNSERNIVWLELLLDVFKSSVDFTAADLFLKYFNIPDEAINEDFFSIMREANSVFDQLIQDEAFNTAFQFLNVFPPVEALTEFQHLLKTASEKENSKAILVLAENILLVPFDSLLRDEDTRKILKKEYDKAEKEEIVSDARKLAEILKDEDLLKRAKALEEMLKNNHNEAITQLKEIVGISEFQPLVEEFYGQVLDKGKQDGDVEQYKIAFSYAAYGKLNIKDKQFTEEPAGCIFKYYLTQSRSGETDYYEAEQYRDSCDESLVQNTVAEKMLDLIKDNDRVFAKNLKNRFKVVFQPGEYKFEGEIKKYVIVYFVKQGIKTKMISFSSSCP